MPASWCPNAHRLMLKRDIFMEKDVLMNVLMNIDEWDGTVPMPAILKPKPLWSGKQVFSMFLPDVNIKRTSAWYKEKDPEDMSLDDSQVLIKRGDLIYGCLCKKTLGTGSGGLVHITWMEHGPDATRKLINNIQVRSEFATAVFALHPVALSARLSSLASPTC